MFVITKDFMDIDECTKNVWIMSRDCPLTPAATEAEIKAIMPYKFRLYDGDNNLCYEGWYDGLEGYQDEAFEPLDWAREDSGCTELRYFEGGKWKVL